MSIGQGPDLVHQVPLVIVTAEGSLGQLKRADAVRLTPDAVLGHPVDALIQQDGLVLLELDIILKQDLIDLENVQQVTAIETLIQLLRKRVGSLLLIKDKRLVGFISQKDILGISWVVTGALFTSYCTYPVITQWTCKKMKLFSQSHFSRRRI